MQTGFTPDRARTLLWSLAGNIILIAGVAVFGWPAGNVVLLFWVENVVLGLLTFVAILSARGENQVGTAFFFLAHYGIFCVVHLVFTLLLANGMGLVLTWPAFGLPCAIVALRLVTEFIDLWVIRRGYEHTTPQQAMASPYPRVIVLHLTVLLGMFVLGGAFYSSHFGADPRLSGVLRVLSDWVESWGLTLTPGLVGVLMLVLFKTLADVGVLTLGGRQRTSGVRPVPRPRPGRGVRPDGVQPNAD